MADNKHKTKKKSNPFGTAKFSDPGDTTESAGGLLGGPYPAPNPHQDWVYGGDSIVAPRYYDGEQDKPYDWVEDDVASLQSALIAAGLLSRKGVRAGMWDPDSASAYKKALTWANKLGVPVETLLAQLLDGADVGSGSGGGGGGGGLGPAPISDEDITALAQKVSQGVLGRNLRPEELGNFIPAFRGIYQAQETTPQVGAENLIRHDIAPQGEADAHQVGNVMDTISKLLGG